MTIEAICLKFDISYPTLYAWKEKYIDQCEDLRQLLNPPLLPDVPPRYAQWHDTEDTVVLQASAPSPVKTISDEQAAITINEEDVTTLCPERDLEPSDTEICSDRLSEFEETVFQTVKATVDQDKPMIFKEFYAVNRIAFFQMRQIQRGAYKSRDSPDRR
jgi:hypothetical protein